MSQALGKMGVIIFLFCFLVGSWRGDVSAFRDVRDAFCQWCSGGFVDNPLLDETIFQVASDGEGVTRFVASFPLSCLCVQACIAHRRKLELRLFHLQQAHQCLQDEVDYLRQLHGPDPALVASRGTADAILVAVYLGGRVWQRFYGPMGPSIPIGR
jgi:hypothetical protein